MRLADLKVIGISFAVPRILQASKQTCRTICTASCDLSRTAN